MRAFVIVSPENHFYSRRDFFVRRMVKAVITEVSKTEKGSYAVMVPHFSFTVIVIVSVMVKVSAYIA
jgi:hypothetical protein